MGLTPKLLDVSQALGRRERMDREVLLLRLAQAEQSVAESKAFVARQQRLIVESEAREQERAKEFSTKFLRCLDGVRHQP